MSLKTKSPDPDDIHRAKWSQAARESYYKIHPDNFAGPDASFPIKDASDIADAARLAGHAADPDAVRDKIIEIAHRLGLSDALPKAWTTKDNMKDKKTPQRAANPDEQAHDPAMTAIAEHAQPDAERSTLPDSLNLYLPITRIDQEKREVILTATAERLDAYKTVIGYDGSKEAFAKWRGNIREMHDPHKAVGRALSIEPRDETKEIDLTLRVSRGAEDTWQKVLDGTLTGASIGAKNGKWSKTTWEGQEVPFLERYDLIEVSLVDNPACPGADIKIIRADGVASDVLAADDEEPTTPTRTIEPTIERAGARLSKETMDAMHMARDHAMNAAKSSMDTCGCDDCAAMLNKIAETDDDDGDMDANFLAQPAARQAIADIVRSVLADTLRDQVGPVMQRVNALLARDAQRKDAPDLTRRVDDLDGNLHKILALVEKIAAQPVDGGPVLHGAAVDKRLATQPGIASRSMDDAEIQRRALELGFSPPSDAQAQVRAAARLFPH